jgi:hypothetical protein
LFSAVGDLEKGSDQEQSGAQRDQNNDAFPDLLDDFF